MKRVLFGVLPIVPFLIAAIAVVPTAAMATIPSICDAVSGNLVLNCGFEAGVYTSTIGSNTNTQVPVDWTPNAAFDYYAGYNLVTTSPINSGSHALRIADDDGEAAPALSQTFADKSGVTYTASFYLDNGAPGTSDPIFFDAQIDGTTKLAFNGTAAGSFTKETFTFTGTGSDTLTFTGNSSPDWWYVDDVVVTPLPPSGALLLGALAGLGFVAYRRCKKGTSAFAIA